MLLLEYIALPFFPHPGSCSRLVRTRKDQQGAPQCQSCLEKNGRFI